MSSTLQLKSPEAMTFLLRRNVDTMKMKYTLNIPIDDLFGSIGDTSLEKSDGFNEYDDRVVMDNFSSLADDLYFDW